MWQMLLNAVEQYLIKNPAVVEQLIDFLANEILAAIKANAAAKAS
jgi:hypothetical protein